MSSLLRSQWVALFVAVVGGAYCFAAQPADSESAKPDRSPQKKLVARYLDGFNRGDHAQILSCLTDDVEWDIPGMFHVRGQQEFDKQIENDAFVGRPTVTESRLVEEGDVVVAEGTARAQKKAGGELNVRFCDVFVFREGRIAKLTSYLMEMK